MFCMGRQSGYHLESYPLLMKHDQHTYQWNFTLQIVKQNQTRKKEHFGSSLNKKGHPHLSSLFEKYQQKKNSQPTLFQPSRNYKDKNQGNLCSFPLFCSSSKTQTKENPLFFFCSNKTPTFSLISFFYFLPLLANPRENPQQLTRFMTFSWPYIGAWK